MRIQTFSIMAGTTACNAQCPFCVSKMTCSNGIRSTRTKINWRNFKKACRLAQLSGATTAMLTGKGEPTIFPHDIGSFLEEMKPYDFPMIELQTNGLLLMAKMPGEYSMALDGHLRSWYQSGLSMIAISVVSFGDAENKSIYCPNQEYPRLGKTISYLHDIGFSVRLSCVMVKNIVDCPEAVDKMIEYAHEHDVEQLTLTPVNRTTNVTKEDKYWTWADDNSLPGATVLKIRSHLDGKGTRLMELSHGAIVYDVKGQNVCLSNCLTVKADATELRNLIFFPDGHLRYDWQYAGAILL